MKRAAAPEPPAPAPDSLPDTALGADGRARCWWGAQPQEYRDYHDREWGFPVADDRRLFEKVCLEGFQSGLSWLTILRKRPAFRAAFADFDPQAVARFGPRQIEALLANAAIVRHRGKIESAVHNARCALELAADAGSLAAYFWRWIPDPASRPRRITRAALRELAQTPESRALSTDLKRRAWTFVGPTTLYAFMQAMGLVNDHVEGCWVREAAAAAQRPPRGVRLQTHS